VGNPFRGQFIDGHSSRQDTESLNRLALKLGGVYDDGNQRHVASDRLASLFAPADDADSREPFQLRDAAIWAVVVGASVLALLSPALALVGSLNELTRKRRDRFGYHVQQTNASSTAI